MAYTISRLLAIAVLSTAFILNAQKTAVDGTTPPALASGQPSGAYPLSGFETVNAFNGSLNFHLPLASLQGRGGLSATPMLAIERHWVIVDDTFGRFPQTTDQLPGGFKSDFGPGTLSARQISSNPQPCTTDSPPTLEYGTTLTRLTFTGGDGTQIDFVDAKTGGTNGGSTPGPLPPPSGNTTCSVPGTFSRGRTWLSRDGSSATLVLDADMKDTVVSGASGLPPALGSRTGYMFLKDGTRFRIEDGRVKSIRDRNGNWISYTYGTNAFDVFTFGRVLQITDSSGRTIVITYPNYATPDDVYDKITYTGVGGGRIVEVHYCALDPAVFATSCPNYSAPSGGAKYPVDLFPLPGGSSSTKYNPTVVSYVKLPDNRRYEFSYNAYAELTRVKLPTGGAMQYDWGAGDTTQNASGVIGGSNNIQQIYRRVKARRVYLDDGTTLQNTTTYTTAHSSTGCPLSEPFCSSVTVTQTDNTSAAPANSVPTTATHYFYGGINDSATYFFTGLLYPRELEGREYKVEQGKIGGTPLATTVLTTHSTAWEKRTCVTGELCPGIVPTDIRIKTLTRVNNDTVGESITETYSYDRFNNVTTKNESDGLLSRNINRQFESGTAYVDIQGTPTAPDIPNTVHIRNLPIEESISDSTGTIAKTTFQYDAYTGTFGAAMTTASTVQWDASITTKRGNLTKQSNWLLPSTTRDTYRQYDQTGNVVKTYDPAGNATLIEFSTSFNSTFPTKITNALSQITFNDFNFATGKPISFTDANNKQTSYGYVDPLDRLTSVDYPDGGATTYVYCDVGGATCPTSPAVLPNSVTKSVKQFSCSLNDWIVADSVYDGLGRTIISHSDEVPTSISASNTITSSTIFDGFGRPYKTSNPYRTETPEWTTNAYDSLGRVLSEGT